MEKVIQFKRLGLDTIKSIQMGEYILSSLTPASRSEEQNYGIILEHLTEGESVRWNTGSIENRSLVDLNIQQEDGIVPEDQTSEDESPLLINDAISTITFKAVRYNILGELDGKVKTCKQQIQDMVHAIAKATGRTDTDFIIQKPIIRYI